MGEEQLHTELLIARQEIAARDAVIAAQTQIIRELQENNIDQERHSSTPIRTQFRRAARKLRWQLCH
ncbi:MAG: hypothetical protein Q4E03_00455 [Trueperella sp.]|nr:hypothetical protein [Trueperella sp.]